MRTCLLLLLVACGGDKDGDSAVAPTTTSESDADTDADADTDTDTDTDADTDADTDTDTAVDGASLYASLCSVCHGPAGEGAAAGPALAESLALSDDELILIIQEGQGTMPPTSATADEAQAIVDFMRATF